MIVGSTILAVVWSPWWIFALAGLSVAETGFVALYSRPSPSLSSRMLEGWLIKNAGWGSAPSPAWRSGRHLRPLALSPWVRDPDWASCRLYPPHLGGEEIVAERLAHLQASNADVTVFTSNLGVSAAPRVERVLWLLILRHRALRILNTPVAPGILVSLLKQRPKPDLLHVHTGQALVPKMVAIAAKIRRIPYIAHIHLIVQPSSRPGRLLLPLYYRLGFRRFLRGAEAVVCLTNAMREEVRALWGIQDDKLFVIPNGVDTGVFRRGRERAPLGAAGGRPPDPAEKPRGALSRLRNPLHGANGSGGSAAPA